MQSQATTDSARAPDMLTRREAAQHLRVGLTKFDELRDEGAFPTYWVGKRVRVMRADLERYLASRQSGTPTKP